MHIPRSGVYIELGRMDTRSQFLAEFLGALGAKEIRHLKVSPDSVTGTVVYDPTDPEEQQNFRWLIGESAAPSPAVVRLVALIRREGLLHSDKLQTSRQELFARFKVGQGSICSNTQFSATLEELLQVRVPMVDDGVESDYYFIHE